MQRLHQILPLTLNGTLGTNTNKIFWQKEPIFGKFLFERCSILGSGDTSPFLDQFNYRRNLIWQYLIVYLFAKITLPNEA